MNVYFDVDLEKLKNVNSEAIDQHLMPIRLIVFAIICAKTLAEYLKEKLGLPFSADKMIPEITNLFLGAPSLQPGRERFLKSILEHVCIVQVKKDNSCWLGIVSVIGQDGLRLPDGYQDLWAGFPGVLDLDIGSRCVIVYPPTLLCDHEGETRIPSCGPGVIHHGLFYIEDAGRKLELLNQFLKSALPDQGVT